MDYPSQLPIALQIGHRAQIVSPTVRSQLASGRARQRRAYNSVPQNVSLEWVFSVGEARVFEYWFQKQAEGGASWIMMPVRTPLGCLDEKVRFIDAYDGPTIVSGNLFRYRAEVEIFEHRVVPTPPQGFDSNLFDLIKNEQWPESQS